MVKEVPFSEEQYNILLSLVEKGKKNKEILTMLKKDAHIYLTEDGAVKLKPRHNKRGPSSTSMPVLIEKPRRRTNYEIGIDKFRQEVRLTVKIDTELNNKLKKIVKSKNLKIRDVMLEKIEDWLKSQEDFSNIPFLDSKERKNNGYAMPLWMRNAFRDLVNQQNTIQSHVIECLMLQVIEEKKEPL